MRFDTATLLVFIQGVLHTLVNAIYSCVCISPSDNLVSGSDKELDAIASDYNQLYICVGDMLGKPFRYWCEVTCARWKSHHQYRAEQVRTLLSLLSLTYLYFAKQVAASSLVCFYRYAPANAATSITNGTVSLGREHASKSNVTHVSIHPMSSNRRKMIAAFFVFNNSSLSSC
ncbi:hypothetical protein C9J03_00470 [Photobacterium gaetbulicola]|uniref:Uncharacterized protein n=1 Tax=Photobacterium gaetbulicola Gung47 TaxID=658445 RepID=A0A0C5WEQ7_9GAMM|nr:MULTISPECIES: hypothetical protein [Photobacterium]AJR05613.1 hypothetical protein H744_1c0588 [Photobacterium gaetbulicola Gung47]PSU14594.1 hypothetical protein C9J03_00470 [Photobacterium gaetbulicola]WEM44237.1 hypothetical protein PTW35_23400 [Photobacterium sp. DA100]